jgi:hypothetical protein
LTLQSIAIGLDAHLLTINYIEATLRGNTPEPWMRKPTLPERIRGFTGAAEKIGYWFWKVGLYQVASTLKVEF